MILQCDVFWTGGSSRGPGTNASEHPWLSRGRQLLIIDGHHHTVPQVARQTQTHLSQTTGFTGPGQLEVSWKNQPSDLHTRLVSCDSQKQKQCTATGLVSCDPQKQCVQLQGWSLVTLRVRNSVQLQGWSLVTLRKICLLWPSETVYSYKVGPLWPSETVYIYKVGLRKVSHLWPSETVYSYMVGPLWPSETTCAATRLVSCDPQKLYSYKVGLLWRSESVQLQGWSLVTLRKCTADCLNCCSSCASQWSATGILADLVPCVHTACQRSVSQLTQTLVGTAVERVLDSGQLEIYPCVFDVTGDLSLCLWHYSCRRGARQWATGDLSLCLWCYRRFILVSLMLQEIYPYVVDVTGHLCLCLWCYRRFIPLTLQL